MQLPSTRWQAVPPEQPTVVPAPGHTGALGRGEERYEWLGELARGGMGAVLLVRDTRLNRTLAIKVLLEEHRDRPDMVHRFLEEAQITGQLQHPCIVPVHELGTLADGRPFFSMKLVRGKTLAELLAARQSP